MLACYAVFALLCVGFVVVSVSRHGWDTSVVGPLGALLSVSSSALSVHLSRRSNRSAD